MTAKDNTQLIEIMTLLIKIQLGLVLKAYWPLNQW